MPYAPHAIEPKWQSHWEKHQPFKAVIDPAKPKFYALDMFPYPSAQGLHVGHPEGYTASDIVSRYKRARGFNVLHPMGWDAFGLPAEQYAIKTGVAPQKSTGEAIGNFTRQLKMLGFSFDWSREIATCDPAYYRWTQWIFLKLHEKGLAYRREVPVNWCPELKTVLANDEVIDGKSERGGFPVFRVPMNQWMLEITQYAERLLKDLDGLDWPESTKELQRNWIGRSEGLKLAFHSAAGPIEVFTTRPDTLFGVSFLVLAPEHPLVKELTTPDQRSAVDSYREAVSRKSEVVRQESAAKEKTGCFTGAFAKHPKSGVDIPIWIADYVMMGYGTGAIMAVPGHDERDFAFATAFGLPITEVVRPKSGESTLPVSAFTELGISVNSPPIDGLPSNEAKAKMIDLAESEKWGSRMVTYRLRDWLFSRQRYWGEPFPIAYLPGTTTPIGLSDQLPVVLPDVEKYEPADDGKSPLAAAATWLRTHDAKSGQELVRETDTMPGSAGSSWYFLRYCDPQNDKEFCSKEAEAYWMPVDLYVGGSEHAVGHLLYSRFWTKVLFDLGLVSHDEPFKKLVHQGMILGEDGEKMSKRRGNVINPDDVVKMFGADTLRLYEMFMGPLEKEKPWSTAQIEGVSRFLHRFWRLFRQDAVTGEESSSLQEVEATPEDLKSLHKTIRKVTEDIEGLRFNTAISELMVCVNHFTKAGRLPSSCGAQLIQLLQPFAPHLAEELWSLIGRTDSLPFAAWPAFDAAIATDDLITIGVQVLGKTRGSIDISPDATQAEVEAAARAAAGVAAHLEGKTVKKVIYVPRKIVNFVVA